MNLKIAIIAGICFILPAIGYAQQTRGLISNSAEKETDFPVVATYKTAATIRYDEADWKGVIRAIGGLQTDINSVTGVKPTLLTSEDGQVYFYYSGGGLFQAKIDLESGKLTTPAQKFFDKKEADYPEWVVGGIEGAYLGRTGNRV